MANCESIEEIHKDLEAVVDKYKQRYTVEDMVVTFGNMLTELMAIECVKEYVVDGKSGLDELIGEYNNWVKGDVLDLGYCAYHIMANEPLLFKESKFHERDYD